RGVGLQRVRRHARPGARGKRGRCCGDQTTHGWDGTRVRHRSSSPHRGPGEPIRAATALSSPTITAMRFDSSVDLRLLTSFVTLAEELHFTRAAERLHVAQPALSQQIARLERQLGFQLFDRPPRPIALTAAGRSLLDRVTPALALLEQGVLEAKALAGE